MNTLRNITGYESSTEGGEMPKTVFELGILTPSGNWEPIPEGTFDSLAEARAAMTELEANLGWRGMRVTSYQDADDITGREVLEYGTERTDD